MAQGANPSLYKTLLTHLASHGFVVIASNSPNVSQGTPTPMLAGVTWVLEQNAQSHERHVSAHRHHPHRGNWPFARWLCHDHRGRGRTEITTIAPLCGATTQRNLHGPAMLFCGGMDETVPCSTIMTAFNGITNQPVMLASYLAADHANWITFRSTGRQSRRGRRDRLDARSPI